MAYTGRFGQSDDFRRFTYNRKGNLISEIPRSPLARHMIEASKQP